MALIARNGEYVILAAQRNIIAFNTKDETHTLTQVPRIPRKKDESNDDVDEKNNENDKNKSKGDNIDEKTSNGHGNVEFGDINRLAVSPCNRFVAVTTIGDKFLFLFEFNDGAMKLRRSSQLARAISTIRFTPNSTHLLIADKTGDCYLQCIESDHPTNEPKWILGHLSIVLDILTDSDFKYIITCDRDEKIRITNYPQTKVIESYCLGHQEFVPAIAELKIASCDNVLLSISGDKTLRLWNYVDGRELFQLELTARGLRLAQNTQNEFAVVLFEENFKIGIFEVTTKENKPVVHAVAEHALGENVKFISSIIYKSNDVIWISGLDEHNDVVLKQLEVVRANGQTQINETNLDNMLNILKENLSSNKLQACEDITLLFKKSFDNLSDYQERKKRRIEKKHNK